MSTAQLRAPLRTPRPRQPTRLSLAPSVLVALMSPGQNFLDGNLAGVLTKLFDIGHRLIDFLLPLGRLGHDSRNRPAMARDDDCFATFDFVEQLRKVGLGLGGLNFACHHLTVDWSN